MLRFMERMCGIIILPWAKRFIREVYEVDPDTGLRIRSRGLLSMARKNGKTHIMAGVNLGHLAGPEAHHHPDGSVFISAAGASQKQAKLVHESMKGMVYASPLLSTHLEVLEDTIRHRGTGSYYESYASVAKGLHGLRPAVWTIDELAQAQNDHSLGAFELSQGNLPEPLGFVAVSYTHLTLPTTPYV